MLVPVKSLVIYAINVFFSVCKRILEALDRGLYHIIHALCKNSVAPYVKIVINLTGVGLEQTYIEVFGQKQTSKLESRSYHVTV